MSAESVEPNQLFLTITQQIFNNWTALLIAIRHGDHSVQEKAAWFPGAIFEVDWILAEKIGNIYTDEIEQTLETILDEEFNLRAEDESIAQVAAELHKFYHLIFVEKNFNQVNLLVNNLPKNSSEKMAEMSRIEGDGDISDGDSFDGENGQNQKSSSSKRRENQKPIMTEDGFTVVPGSQNLPKTTDANPKLSKKQLEKLAKQNEMFGDIMGGNEGENEENGNEGDWEMS